MKILPAVFWRDKFSKLVDWPQALLIAVPLTLFVIALVVSNCKEAFALIGSVYSGLPFYIKGGLALLAVGKLSVCLARNIQESNYDARVRRNKKNPETGGYQDLWSLDPDFPFYDQRIFSWAMRISLCFGGLMTLILFAGQDSPIYREFQPDVEGMSNFFDLYQYTFYSLSLMAASGVMVARFHRSKQMELSIDKTQKSIDLTSQKNDFDFRWKHQEQFLEHLNDFPHIPIAETGIKVGFKAYSTMYSNAFPGNELEVKVYYFRVRNYRDGLELLKKKTNLMMHEWESSPNADYFRTLSEFMLWLRLEYGLSFFDEDGNEDRGIYWNSSLAVPIGMLFFVQAIVEAIQHYYSFIRVWEGSVDMFLEDYKSIHDWAGVRSLLKVNGNGFLASVRKTIEQKRIDDEERDSK